MDHEATFAELEQKAAEMGVEVRLEPFYRNSKSPGGLIRLHGKYIALINHKVLPSERVAALEGALDDAAVALGLPLATSAAAPGDAVAAE